MEIKCESNSDVERKMARTILPLRRKHHLVMISLIIADCLAAESLPLFLDTVVDTVGAIVLSVILMLFFGEIIPQAICTGPKQLTIAYKCIPIVQVVMFLTAPISWPIAKFMDRLLGAKHAQRLTKTQLDSIIDIHSDLSQKLVRKDSDP